MAVVVREENDLNWQQSIQLIDPGGRIMFAPLFFVLRSFVDQGAGTRDSLRQTQQMPGNKDLFVREVPGCQSFACPVVQRISKVDCVVCVPECWQPIAAALSDITSRIDFFE